MKDITLPEPRNIYSILPATDLFRTIRVGAIAVSGINISAIAKQVKSATKATRSPMILGAVQGYNDPPHWRARTRQVIDGMKKMIPIGSRSLSFASGVLVSVKGDCMSNSSWIAINVHPPMGRLR